MDTIKSGLCILGMLGIAACGGGGGSGSAPPEPANTAPLISGEPVDQIRAREDYSFTPQASDADGDNLSFSIANAPAWAVFRRDTGELSGTPARDDRGIYEDIVITVSDGTASTALPAFSLTVLPARLTEADLSASGTIISTDDGYRTIGTLAIDTGGETQLLENADITAGFDEGGNLAELVGVTDFPVILGGTDGVALNATVDAPVRATVRMMSGAEINADETFNVQLIPENDYFVFYVGGSLTLNLTNARDPSDDRVMPLEPPFGSEWLFISDVNDPMYYYYAHVPLVPLVPAVGEGFSYHGWLPFEPSLDYEELDSFNGTELKEGTLSLGIKLVDVFEFNGLRVLKKSTLKDIDWTDPFNSPFEFKAGLNGDSNIIWSVIGIGFFRMDFSEISATLDVGFDRQHMAMMQRIAPDVSWQPDWFHITPTTEAIGKWSIDGDGTAEIGISAGFDSRIPESNLSGELFLSTDTASFRGATTIGDTPLAVSLSFMNETTTGAVEFPESFGESITDDVSAAVDRRIGDVEATIAEYEDALTQFGELEINLDNIRTSIVVSTLTAIGRLPLVPSQVYQFVYTTVSTELNNACETRFTITRCASDYVDVDDVATRAANGARDIASDNILRYSAALQDLSAAAQEATDEELRQALRQALLTAYDLRSFVQRVTFSQDVRIVISTIVAGDIVINRTVSFDRDFRIELLTPTQAQLLLTAVDNIDQLTATGGIVIDLELLVDQLPTREILDSIREEVTSGVRAVPIPEGLGYTAAGNNYSAFVTIDGEDRPVEFNVLRPSDVREGVSDLLLDLLLP